MIRYSDLVKKTMPPEKLAMAKVDWIGHYLVRPICNVVSIPLIEMGFSPMTITLASALFPILALFFFIRGNNADFYIAWFCIFVWNVLDGVDGNIARYTDNCTNKGDLWDVTVGFVAWYVFYLGMGFIAFRSPGNWPSNIPTIPEYYYLLMGAIAGNCYVFPRMIMYRKIMHEGENSVREVKRGNYGFLKQLAWNLTSINGLGAIVFLLLHIIKLNGLCMLFYFIVSMAACMKSLYELLK